MSKSSTALLASNLARSVVRSSSHEFAYSAYGYDPPRDATSSQLGFNGVIRDPWSGCYPLGNGYRTYSPVLMRFCSPDRLSPFADGGINSYGYCSADPINHADPRGTFKQVHQRRAVDLGQLSDLPKAIQVERVGSVHHTDIDTLKLRYPGHSDLISKVTTQNALFAARALPNPDRIAGNSASFNLPDLGITSGNRDLLEDIIRQGQRAVAARISYAAAPVVANAAAMQEHIDDYSEGKEALVKHLAQKVDQLRNPVGQIKRRQ
ncbi:RHS repeat-associated protein [Pseudomonas sp. 2848]|uniref:RHS repeat-associated core domain-containing protein n=1 Tax=Pseudomonas sp. 2848 TaxID=2183926 RepID=UPI000DAE9A5E|nr:RHS repeat-associated core domain-containing protein [Pseudomonas sp. 2848]PZW81528.1 RHS repeat-associated protein [Pseudomonas sp. 2848]